MTTYKRLGDYIREVNVRNRELKVTKLVGLTIDKAFIPSVANVIGTDLSNYKVIQREQFACSLMQVSPDGRSQLQVQLLLKFSFYQFHAAKLQTFLEATKQKFHISTYNSQLIFETTKNRIKKRMVCEDHAPFFNSYIF